MMKSGHPIKEIARRERVSDSYVARLIPLATLSPRIQEAVVAGLQPPELSLETLARYPLPLEWSEQESRFGFSA
jgi:hypothetical protein